MIQTEFDFFPDSVKIPDGATLLRTSEWGDGSWAEYLLSEEDKGKRVTKNILHVYKNRVTGETITRESKQYDRKFLCVNGPLKALLMTEEKAKEWKYTRFNCADRNRCKNEHRVVLVHFE